MPISTFPLGQAIEDDPQVSMLQVRLFENDPPAEGFSSLAQITEATYPDYQGSRPTDWSDPDVIDENWVYRKSKKVDFRTQATTPGKLVKGWYVTVLVAGVPQLVAYELFSAPIPMATPNANVVVQVELNCFDVGFVSP